MKNHYFNLVKQLNPVNIMVIGDIMLDRFIIGEVKRISPEAPVPIVNVKKELYMPGGAGNVACNIKSFGSFPIMIGMTGQDIYGDLLLQNFNQLNISVDGILRSQLNTTIVKTRVIAESQQVVRVDRDGNNLFDDFLLNEIKSKIKEGINLTDVVVISDYGKGLINNEILHYVTKLALDNDIPILVDPKIENFKKYKNITCMTPNLLEAKQGMGREKVATLEEIEKLGLDIVDELNATSILITRSEHGMSLFEKNKITHIPTMAKEVFDVTGAGDTVISTLAICLGNGLSLKDSAYISNYAAGIVVGKLGTATTNIDEILDYLKNI